MVKVAKKLLGLSTLMMVGGTIALGALSSNCGGSGGERTGTAGATGSGGSTGTGGTGGGDGGTALSCAVAIAPPTGGAVTNFSDYNATSGKWGAVGSLRGSKFSYAAASSTHMHTIDPMAADPDLHFTATVQPAEYAGVGLSFDACATLTGYTGIQFSISGSLGGCALEFQLQTFSQKPTNENPAGGCDQSVTSCHNFPKKLDVAQPTTTDMTVTVMFSELSGFVESNLAEAVGLQWQVTVPPGQDGGAQTPCTVDLRIDDVAFIQ